MYIRGSNDQSLDSSMCVMARCLLNCVFTDFGLVSQLADRLFFDQICTGFPDIYSPSAVVFGVALIFPYKLLGPRPEFNLDRVIS